MFTHVRIHSGCHIVVDYANNFCIHLLGLQNLFRDVYEPLGVAYARRFFERTVQIHRLQVAVICRRFGCRSALPYGSPISDKCDEAVSGVTIAEVVVVAVQSY